MLPEKPSVTPTTVVDGVARALSARASRRSFLAKTIVATSAFAAGPLRYLIYATPAWANAPGDCPPDSMCGVDSVFTEFCCTLYGGSNNCPTNTHLGGWWYANVGSGYCNNTTYRYYLDCLNLNCTCHCARGKCSNRHVCCNTGYTNCSPGGSKGGNVYCRIVRCVEPDKIHWGHGITCKPGGALDQRTCCHHANGPNNCNFKSPTCAQCNGNQYS